MEGVVVLSLGKGLESRVSDSIRAVARMRRYIFDSR